MLKPGFIDQKKAVLHGLIRSLYTQIDSLTGLDDDQYKTQVGELFEAILETGESSKDIIPDLFSPKAFQVFHQLIK